MRVHVRIVTYNLADTQHQTLKYLLGPMPRNTKGHRKSKNHGLSEASKKKLDAIGVDAQEEIYTGWTQLADFEIQST